MKVLVTILLLFACCLQMDAQDSRNAKFYISPGHISFLKINNQTLYQLDTMQYPYRVELPAGEHYVEVWSPKYNLYKDSVLITTDSITKIVITLKDKTAAQRTFDKKNIEFKLRKVGRVAAVAAIIGSDIGWTLSQLNKLEGYETAANLTYDRVLEAKEKYENTISVSGYDTYRTEYNELNDQYKAEQEVYRTLKNKTILINGGAALLLSGTVYAFTKIKLKKPVKPIFDNPFLSSSSLHISPSSLGLTLNF
jgi:hypothetical protein